MQRNERESARRCRNRRRRAASLKWLGDETAQTPSREVSRLPRQRFNAFAQFRKIRLQDAGTGQRNCDAISRQIALTD
jgi:hypothetical protein